MNTLESARCVDSRVSSAPRPMLRHRLDPRHRLPPWTGAGPHYVNTFHGMAGRRVAAFVARADRLAEESGSVSQPEPLAPQDERRRRELLNAQMED
jgi:hypothetical protein